MKFIIVIIIVAILLKVFFKRYKPIIKGEIGEIKVNLKLKFLPKGYKIINDVMLSNNHGKTVQIDHIVVGYNGVFVIETKNYSGTVCGGADEVRWKQIFYKSSHDFYNPLLQNKGHITELRYKLRNFKDVPIHSIVAFGEDCNLMVDNSIKNVMYMGQVREYIKNFKSDVILDSDKVEKVTKVIKDSNIKSIRTKRQHRMYVKQKYK